MIRLLARLYVWQSLMNQRYQVWAQGRRQALRQAWSLAVIDALWGV